MGVELPHELRQIAAEIGVDWPQADEDAICRRAVMWRSAKEKLALLVAEAQSILYSVQPALAGVAAGSGAEDLTSNINELARAMVGAEHIAGRLEGAASAIGNAKVDILRILVDVARNRDVAHSAAIAGNPDALAGVESMLRAAAVDISAVLSQLVDTLGASESPNTSSPAGGVGKLGSLSTVDIISGSEHAVVAHPRGETTFVAPVRNMPGTLTPPSGIPIGPPGGTQTLTTEPSYVGFGSILSDLAPRADKAASAAAPLPVNAANAANTIVLPSVERLTPLNPPHKTKPARAASAANASAASFPVSTEVTSVLLRKHMFPISHNPDPATRPARQQPTPAMETDFSMGLGFPPEDHPMAGSVDTGEALTKVRDGWSRFPSPPGKPVASIMNNYRPCGGMPDHEWNHRYLGGVRVFHGEYAWPPGMLYPEGCEQPGIAVTLPKGTLLDRFGPIEGRVFFAEGTSFARRSLPPHRHDLEYRRYQVLRPTPMWVGRVSGWFGQPGGGTRYRATCSADELVSFGYLADITFEDGQ